ncbi:MAG: LysR family transcriptional regulator [Alphaproteobacteria bacterium]|nr:LysR family transcriptional regulator [Alphaproteobacteria bacterium]
MWIDTIDKIDMKPTQLRAFHQVARARGFTRASAAAGVGQPTLSGQVTALEKAYGVRLFDRRGRGVQLTELGQSLYALTDRMFGLEEEARALLSGTATLAHGHLRVSADSAYHAVPILAELKRRHSGLTFSLSLGNSMTVLRRLFDYEADVVVMAKLTADPRLYTLPFRADRLVLFVPLRHAWARRRRIRLSELSGQDMVLRERGSVTRGVFEATLAAAAVRPGAIIEVESREGVGEAVAAGFGIGVVFESEFRADDRFHRIAVTGSDLAVAEYVVCLEERRRLALVRAFLEVAGDMAGDGA